MPQDQSGPPMVKITAADMERFHGLAETTLARTNRAWFIDEIGRCCSWILAGAIPLAGLLVFGWSAKEWLLFLLIGAWVGVACDAVKLWLLHRQVMSTAAKSYDNNFVWTIVDALRAGKDVAMHDHLRARYQPGMGVIVDLLFGGVGTAMVIGLFPENLLQGRLDNATLQWGVGGFVLYRLLLTVWEISETRSSKTPERSVLIASGLRGAGLFCMGFLVAMLAGDESKPNFSGTQTAWWTMLIINGLLVLVSLLSIWGMLMIASNARWLRNYMAERKENKRD